MTEFHIKECWKCNKVGQDYFICDSCHRNALSVQKLKLKKKLLEKGYFTEMSFHIPTLILEEVFK
jgi:hypothetical protein